MMPWQEFLALDARLSQQLRIAEQPGWLRNLAIFFAHSGDSWFWLLALILVWWLGPPALKTLTPIFAIAIFIAALLVFAVKFTVRRRRPEGEWGGIYRNTDPHSFPSGHATRAALLAVLAIGLGPPWLAILLGIWAPLVILARVVMGVHYLSDVLAGAVLGVILGLAVLIIL